MLHVHRISYVDKLIKVDDANVERPRRRLTQAEAKRRTRAQLLAAAAQVFARKGFAGASLEEISELAGYTTGALYYHFPNKERLFLDLLRTGLSRQLANWSGFAERVFEAADPFDELSRIAVGRSERDRELEPLQGEFWLYALRNAGAMEIFAEELRKQTRALEPIIEAAVERSGSVPGMSSEEMTIVALTLFQGLARRRRIDPDAVAEDLLARALRQLFGVATGPSARPEGGGEES